MFTIEFASASPRPQVAYRGWLPLAACVALALGGGAHAATIVVDSSATDSEAGKCTLVDAVAALDTKTAVNGCAAADGNNDTIDLTGFKTPTTISFLQSTSGYGHALSFTNAASVVGARDANGVPYVTIERSSASGVPDFGLIQTSAPLTIDGLTLRNGVTPSSYLGGAIRAGDTLIVRNSVITGNTSASAGGGIAGTSGVTLTNTTVSNNSAGNAGGGVYSSSTVTLVQSVVTGNSATSATAKGGGIYSLKDISASNSTISNNTSADTGGGLQSTSMVALTNSTVTGNSAKSGGGAYATGGGASLTGSTMNGNTATYLGGAIHASVADLTNSTITGNTAGTGGGGIYAESVIASYATIASNQTQAGGGGGVNFSVSMVADGTIVFGNTPNDVDTQSQSVFDGSYDLVGTSVWGVPSGTLSCNPQLGPLADNGGPTLTMALLTGSCAIDAASTHPSESTDQRGFARPAPPGGNADIGAYESGSSDASLIFANGFE